MKYKLGFILTITFWLGTIPRLVAGADGFAGDWMLSFDQGRGARRGLLDIREADGGFIAFVEGGPVTISVDGEEIDIGVDDRTGGGEPFVRHFVGALSGDVIEGKFGPETPSEFCQQFPLSCDDPQGVWRAERIVASPPRSQPPRPVDLSGVWSAPPGGGGIARYTMDLTPEAQAWVDNFDTELDFPAQRCISSGLFRRFTSGIEIWRYDSHFTFLYSGGEVRRIYTDGRSRPDYIFPTPLGHSLGTWDGSTLVVETIGLQPVVRGYRGEPISENARFVERYTLNEDGATLTGLLTLHDPENYRRPPLRRMSWNPSDPGAETGPMVSCDPDSFYRQLYEDGKMQEYIDRSDLRL